MNSISRQEIGKGIYFNTIKDNRFKTMKLSVSIIVPLNEDDASVNALLAGVLTRSTKDYPDFTILSKKLSQLYGANLAGIVRKMGDNQVLTFSISGIDDKYAFEGDVVSQQMSELLCSVLFRPKLNGNAFCEEEINQEKRQLSDMIDSEFNDKRAYANNRFTEFMCQGEPFACSRLGTKEAVEEVTGEDLYTAWKKLLIAGNIEIFFIGESDSENAKNIFEKNFKKNRRTPFLLENSVCGEVKKLKEKREIMELSQSKMIMGFRTSVASPSEDTMAMRVAIALLGGTAHSKLFNNVREKLSLCYYCSARYTRIKGIVHIESGVEKENIEKAKDAILKEIEDMKNGNITDFEIEATKLSMCNDFITICDHTAGLESWYLSQLMDGELDSVEEACRKVNAVTKEQIMEMASKLHFDTIYTLESK
ncbi:MAG: insulinase family protein [Oscillospiraceae bacterium]|nr:insulinase family protein [Oscillospiraceae bacterium]